MAWFCWPWQVMPGLAQPCTALTDPSWPLPVLSGTYFSTMPGPALPCPGWGCPVLAGAALIQSAWRCPARPCPTLLGRARPWSALHEPVRPHTSLLILPWPTQPGSTLSCLALHCLTLPFPLLSGSAEHARFCPMPSPVRYWPTLHDHARFCSAMSGTARHFPSLPGHVLRSPHTWPGPAHSCPVSNPVRPTLSGPVRSAQIIIVFIFLVCNILHESKMYSSGQQTENVNQSC